MTQMNKSVTDFVKEQEARRETYENVISQVPINSKKYGTILSIVDAYLPIDVLDIIPKDIAYMKKSDVIELLECSGYKNEEAKTLTVEFDRRVMDLFSNNVKDINKARDYFSKIIRDITTFINQYRKFSHAEYENNKQKIESINELIDNLTNDKEFTDIDGLVQTLCTNGKLDEDKINILEYIMQKNLEASYDKTMDAEETRELSDLISKCVNDDNELIPLINEYMSDKIYDVYSLPTISNEIDKKYKINNPGMVLNTMSLMLISTLIDDLNEEYKEDRVEAIKILKSYIKPAQYDIISEAQNILADNNEFFFKEIILKDIDADTLLDYEREELEEKYKDDYSKAKTAPLVNQISNLLDAMESQTESEKIETTALLNQLVDAYKDINNRALNSRMI